MQSPKPARISEGTASGRELPLCVDLDGTLIATDLLWECLVSLLRNRFWMVFLVPFWLLRGRDYLKQQLTRTTSVDVALLPYRPAILDFVKSEHEAGRKVFLVTASDETLAARITAYLGCFDGAYGTSIDRNLKGSAKSKFLVEKFGDHGYDYMGDSKADIPVWTSARKAYVVGSERLGAEAAKAATVESIYVVKGASVSAWLKAVRGLHWSKNVLLFVPLALAHGTSPNIMLRTLAAFVLFGMCASTIYILNDLLDLHSDRAHPWKSSRPFASSTLPISAGLWVCTISLPVTLALSFMLSPAFGGVVLFYSALTVAYSIYLKRIALVDVFTLSGFYCIRLWAGATAAGVPLSQWFLGFSVFFFLSLAIAKRYSEILQAGELVASGRSGRGYQAGDREVLLVLGVCSSFAAVLTLSLYVHSADVTNLYLRPEPLMALCPLMLYWLSRLWLSAHRGELVEDPVAMAVKDRMSYVVALMAVIAFVAAQPR